MWKKGRRAKAELGQQRLAAEKREKQRIHVHKLRTQGIGLYVVENDRPDSFRLASTIKWVPPFSDDVEQF